MSSNAGNNMGNDAAQGQSSLNISSATVQSIDAVPRGMDQSSGDMQAGTSGTAGTTSGATGSMMYRVTLRLDDGTTRTFVQNTQPAFQIGDRVSVRMPEGRVLRLSALVYIFPLIFLIAGLMLGSALSQGRESIMLLYGFLLLALSLIIVKIADVTLGKKAGWHPDIVEVNPEIEQEDSFICAEMKKR